MRGSTRVQQHDRLIWAWRYCERPLFVLLAVFADLAEDRLQQWVCLNAVFTFTGLLGEIGLGGVFQAVGNGKPLAFGEVGGFKGHGGWFSVATPPLSFISLHHNAMPSPQCHGVRQSVSKLLKNIAWHAKLHAMCCKLHQTQNQEVLDSSSKFGISFVKSNAYSNTLG